MKAMKLLMGIGGGATSTYPCPCCMVDRKDLSKLCAGEPRTDYMDNRIPIRLDRIHPCTMHCIHRVGEKVCICDSDYGVMCSINGIHDGVCIGVTDGVGVCGWVQ